MIPLVRPYMPKMSDIEKYLEEPRKTGAWTNFGPNYQYCVEKMNKDYGRYMLPVSNGTTAIELACKTTLNPSDRVVIPDYTHVGTYAGVRAAGNPVVISDCFLSTWTLDLNTLRDHLNDFDAMVVVSPFGYAVPTDYYENFAKENNKKIIYDFAGAWGQFPKTKFPVCYSTHATKVISTGEGGIVSFEKEKDFEKARQISNFCVDKKGKIKDSIGHNYKMDEIRCAILRHHLNNTEPLRHRALLRRGVFSRYREYFRAPFIHWASPSMAVVCLDKFDTKKHKNFQSKHYYPLLHTYLNEPVLYPSANFFKNLVALPIDVTEKEQDSIIEAILND